MVTDETSRPLPIPLTERQALQWVVTRPANMDCMFDSLDYPVWGRSMKVVAFRVQDGLGG